MSGVNIIFSHNETADDKIKALAAQHSAVKNVIVVTDDRAIQYAVKASGARIMSVKEFLGKCEGAQEKGKQKRRLQDSGERKNITKVMEFKINDEMKNIWLKKKS